MAEFVNGFQIVVVLGIAVASLGIYYWVETEKYILAIKRQAKIILIRSRCIESYAKKQVNHTKTCSKLCKEAR